MPPASRASAPQRPCPPPLALLARFLPALALPEGLREAGAGGALPLKGRHRTEDQEVESHTWFQAILLCDSEQATSLSEPVSWLS